MKTVSHTSDYMEIRWGVHQGWVLLFNIYPDSLFKAALDEIKNQSQRNQSAGWSVLMAK